MLLLVSCPYYEFSCSESTLFHSQNFLHIAFLFNSKYLRTLGKNINIVPSEIANTKRFVWFLLTENKPYNDIRINVYNFKLLSN